MPTASRLTLAAAILAGSIISASAADMRVAPPPPPPPIYDWSGFYLGFGIGVASHEAAWTFTNVGTIVNHDFDQTRIQVHGGYQYMFGLGWGGIVLGVDFAAAYPLEDTIGSTLCPNPAFTCQTRFNGLFTVGGKLGVAFPSLGFGGGFMIYGSGGYAAGDINTDATLAPAAGSAFGDGGWEYGWYVGGGVDWAAYKGNGIDLILGFEYKHIEFDDFRHFLPFGLVSVGSTRDVTVTSDQFMAKATLKFGPRLW